MYKLKDKKLIFRGKFDPKVLNYIGSGANAKVYNVKVDNENYALKIFDMPKIWSSRDLKQMTNINVESFITPEKLFYVNHKFKGYIMKLCKGKDLKNNKLDITIREFINSSKKLIYDTNRLSELGYLLDDVSLKNLIYDDGFKVLDTDLFEYCDDKNNSKDINSIKRQNKFEITMLLVDTFINSIGLVREFNKDIKLNNLKNGCIDGSISFVTFIETICKMVNKENDYLNITLSELGSKLKETFNIDIESDKNISF